MDDNYEEMPFSEALECYLRARERLHGPFAAEATRNEAREVMKHTAARMDELTLKN